MGKEIDELPCKPKCLINMDPTKFCPTWNKQGRCPQRYLAKNTYEDMEDALYVKGIARVEILAAVDDSRKVLDVIYSDPSGTPIAEFMEYHKEEIKERMRKSQLMISDACSIYETGTMDLQEKFETLRHKFKADKPSREELEQDIAEIREKSNDKITPELPKPRVPVFCMVGSEAQLYMQELLGYVVKNIFKLKKTEFRKWPQV